MRFNTGVLLQTLGNVASVTFGKALTRQVAVAELLQPAASV